MMAELCGACWNDDCELRVFIEDFEREHGMELEIKGCPAFADEPPEEE